MANSNDTRINPSQNHHSRSSQILVPQRLKSPSISLLCIIVCAVHASQATIFWFERCFNKSYVIFRFVSDFRGLAYSCPMLEVLSAVTGESIALFEEVDFAESSVKALKQRLAQKIGIPRFRLRLLQDQLPTG